MHVHAYTCTCIYMNRYILPDTLCSTCTCSCTYTACGGGSFKGFLFPCRYMKGTQERGMILGSVEEIVQILDDNAMNLQSMSSSRFVGPFLDRVQKWEKSLSHISEVVDVSRTTLLHFATPTTAVSFLFLRMCVLRCGWWCSVNGCTWRASSLGETFALSCPKKPRSLIKLTKCSERYDEQSISQIF